MNDELDYKEFIEMDKQKLLTYKNVLLKTNNLKFMSNNKKLTETELLNYIFDKIKILVKENPNLTKTDINKKISAFINYSESYTIKHIYYLILKNKIRIVKTGNKNQRRIEIVENPNPITSE